MPLLKILILVFFISIELSAQVIYPVQKRRAVTIATEDTTNWYVSNTGNDGNTGHSTDSPLQTIAGLETKLLQAGDSIFFNKGDIWYESLTISASGTAGSPIVITSYGTGDEPIISGALAITEGWVQNSNVYAVGCASQVYDLFANGVRQTLARLPNLNTYYKCDAGTGTTKIIADELTAAEDAYVGATACIRAEPWRYNRRTVNSSKDDSISVSAVLSGTPGTTYGMYLEGLESFIDTTGEFWYDSVNDSLYFQAGSDPNAMTIEATIRQYGITDTASYVHIDGIQFDKQYSAGVYVSGSPDYVRIENCKVTNQYNLGIYFTSTATYATVKDNIITDTHGSGINMYYASYSQIENDSLDRIGTVPGKAEQPFGIITTAGTDNAITKCRLDSIGYSGIYGGSYSRIDSNVISNTVLVLEDGGGIYLGNTFANPPLYTSVTSNIIENVIGGGYINRSGSYPSITVGIYFDAGTRYCKMLNNTIKGSLQYGSFLQYNDIGDTISGNTYYDIKSYAGAAVYDKSAAIAILRSSAYDSDGSYYISRNTVFSSDTTAYIHYYRQIQDSAFMQFGTIDSNKYLNPYNQNRTAYHSVAASAKYLSYGDWVDSTGQEAASEGIWREWISTTQKDSLFVNRFNYPYTFTIAENTWKNYEGTIQGTSLTVPADSAILLFNSPDSDTLLAQYSETNQDADGLMSIANGTPARAQNFIADGNYIYGFWAYVKRIGTSGYYTPSIWSNVGGSTYGGTSRPSALLQKGDSVLTSSFSTSYAWVYFSLGTPYKLTNGTIYHVVLITWDASSSHCLTWGRDTSSPTYAGNPSYGGAGGTLWSQGTSDQCFKVSTYGSGGAP
jgi:hypothetical protein